jgi:pentapeptide MXKDX repeat protein
MKNVNTVMMALCMAFAASSVLAQDNSTAKDTMSHDAMKQTDAMHSDMKKDTMAHDTMKKDTMSNGATAKTTMTKDGMSSDTMKDGVSHDSMGNDSAQH